MELNHLSIIFRLYPTSEQEELFRKNIGCRRKIYNELLALRQENHKRWKQGKNELPVPTEKELKEKFEFLKEVDANSLVQARVDLDKAFKNLL